MTEKEFMQFTDLLTEYLEAEKVFVQNPKRMADVEEAYGIADCLFPEAKITIEDDPIQMGAVFLQVDDFEISVTETKVFRELIAKADNFVVYPIDSETLRLSIMFDHALIRLKS